MYISTFVYLFILFVCYLPSIIRIQYILFNLYYSFITLPSCMHSALRCNSELFLTYLYTFTYYDITQRRTVDHKNFGYSLRDITWINDYTLQIDFCFPIIVTKRRNSESVALLHNTRFFFLHIFCGDVLILFCK